MKERIKIFFGSSEQEIENRINTWLKETEATAINISITKSERGTFNVAILYRPEEKK